MTDLQSYEERISRLTNARRKDSAAKRAAVLRALNELRREDRRITRRTVIGRARVCTEISCTATKISLR